MRKLLSVLLIINALLASCQEKMKEEKFVWSASITAPKEYPIEVIRGLISNGESFVHFGTIYGVNNSGWGAPGGSMDNKTNSQLPNTLTFTWHSLVEDIYYTGTWELDTAYMTKVFKETYKNISRPLNLRMDDIVIGLGPKGKVVLWIDGEQTRVEVGSYQAHDTIITAADLSEDDAHMFKEGRTQRILNSNFYINDELKEKIKKEGYPDPKLYTTYQSKFNWKLQVSWPKPLYDTRIFYYNGEFEAIKDKESIFFKNKRAVPQRFAIGYIDNEKKRGLSVKFHSFDEVIQALNELNTDKEDIILYIELDLSRNDTGKAFLKNKNKQIQLKNVKIWNSYEPAKNEE